MKKAPQKSALKKKDKSISFRENSAGYKHLANEFKKYLQTKEKEGYNPELVDFKTIRGIYDVDPSFKGYSRAEFPKNYKKLGQKFMLNKALERGRKTGKFFIYFKIKIKIITTNYYVYYRFRRQPKGGKKIKV